jgi:hypothetical protein
MTGIRRSLLLLALTVTAVLGAVGPAHPAQAGFGEKVTAAAPSIETATVAAPTAVTGSLTCGRTSATMAANWKASSSSRVSGYVVKVEFNDGYVQTVNMPSTATSWTAPISLYTAQNTYIRYSVTTHTAYGWTMESPLTGWFTC